MYKSREGTEFRGGPQYFIDKGLKSPLFGMLFAGASAIALGFCTPGVQANAIADAFDVAFGVNKNITAVVVLALVAVTIFGGVKRISEVAERVGPIMAGLYLIGGLIIIVVNIGKIPAVLALIVKSAFGQEAIYGAILGKTVIWGVKRGIYSNEAGMGTSSQASSTPYVTHPVKQGLVQSFSVYIDTIFVCTATALIILLTGMYNVEGIVENLPGVQAGPGFVQHGLDTSLAGFGAPFVAIAMFFFAFTTILGNYYAAETGIAYITNKLKSGDNKIALAVLRVVTLVAIFVFASRPSSLAWALGDVGMGVLSWFNLIAMLLLSGGAIKAYKDFIEQYNATGDATFHPKKLGIKNTDDDVWEG